VRVARAARAPALRGELRGAEPAEVALLAPLHPERLERAVDLGHDLDRRRARADAEVPARPRLAVARAGRRRRRAGAGAAAARAARARERGEVLLVLRERRVEDGERARLLCDRRRREVEPGLVVLVRLDVVLAVRGAVCIPEGLVERVLLDVGAGGRERVGGNGVARLMFKSV
jgi:hypothetical protein